MTPIGASLGGGPAKTITSPNSKGIDVGSCLGTATFTELRFRAGPSTDISGREANEVSEFRWFGGEFNDDTPALDNTTLPGAFSELSWLTDPVGT